MTVTKRKKINSGKIISLLNINPFTFSSEVNSCGISRSHSFSDYIIRFITNFFSLAVQNLYVMTEYQR